MVQIRNMATEWWTPDEKEPEFRVKLKPLLSDVFMDVTANTRVTEEGDIEMPLGSLKRAIRHGLVDWDGVTDSNGEVVSFTAGNVNKLPTELFGLIGVRIIEISTVGDEELKNS